MRRDIMLQLQGLLLLLHLGGGRTYCLCKHDSLPFNRVQRSAGKQERDRGKKCFCF